jgi:hypothetical protein
MILSRFMITDNGTHPPEKWAMESAIQLVHIEDQNNGAAVFKAENIRNKIANALLPHHTAQQKREIAGLRENAGAHHASPLEPAEEHIDAAKNAVIEALKDTDADVSSDLAKAKLDFVLRSHFTTQADIERRTHLDSNKGN